MKTGHYFLIGGGVALLLLVIFLLTQKPKDVDVVAVQGKQYYKDRKTGKIIGLVGAGLLAGLGAWFAINQYKKNKQTLPEEEDSLIT